MSMRSGNEQFARDLCAALGAPKYTRSLELRVAVDEAVTIRCEYHPELSDGSLGDLIAIVRRLEARDVSVIGDESRRFAPNQDGDA